MTPLLEGFAKSGGFLFRWRSYLPLAFLPLVLLELPDFQYPGGQHRYDLWWEAVCLSVGAFGLGLRVLTVAFIPEGASGRGTGAPAASRLNTTGLYSLVRNPLYLGNFFAWLAPVVFIRDFSAAVIFILAFALYYERIVCAEEAFLLEKFGERYREWARKTPAFIPRFSNWVRPDLPFSWKMALSREYHGLYGLVAAMFLLETLGDFYTRGVFTLDGCWAAIMAAGTAFYLSVRFLVKKTSRLAAGR